MTPKQEKLFYFPAWHRCAKARGWTMRKGRLIVDLDAQRKESERWPETVEALLHQVVENAQYLARQDHRAPTADDLRHACNMVATATKSSARLTNKQVNRVVCLFRILTDPEDLDAMNDWLYPDHAERRSMIAFLRRKAPDYVIREIAGNLPGGTIYWQDLDMQRLRWIAGQLKNRPPSQKPPNATAHTIDKTDPF